MAVTGFITLGEVMGVAVTGLGHSLRTVQQLRFSTAGAEATVAIGMSRLGHSASWVGVVGNDEVGARVVRDLRAEGVSLPGLRVAADAPTGFMVREVVTAEFGRASYYRRESAGSTLTANDVLAAMADTEADLLHVTGITPALSESCAHAVRAAVANAKVRGMTVSLDVNYRSGLARSDRYQPMLADLLPDVDVLFAGEDELWLISDDRDARRAANGLLGRGPSEVVIKRGTKPALVASHDEVVDCPVRAVQVVDVVGAGDSFAAGYLAARAEGRPVDERLLWATRCAAATVASVGDWEGLPTRNDLEHRGRGDVTLR